LTVQAILTCPPPTGKAGGVALNVIVGLGTSGVIVAVPDFLPSDEPLASKHSRKNSVVCVTFKDSDNSNNVPAVFFPDQPPEALHSVASEAFQYRLA
jgi:hypothetical protein